MTMIGLTGGIGSGKSTVSAMLTRRGALVIDADAVAREVVAPGTPGLAELVAHFGSDILKPSGELDRGALAAKAFADDTSRRRLNSITHPLISQRTGELVRSATPGRVIVHDVPLLVENHLGAAYDLVVVVDAPDDVRLARLEERGVPEDEARRRMAAQCSREERLAAADIVVENDRDHAHLEAQVERLWRVIGELDV